VTRPKAIVVGFIGKNPVAGMALYNLHYIAGLQDLGYRVHYVEHLNRSNECYNPETDCTTDDTSYAVRYLHDVLATVGLPPSSWSFIDRSLHCHGAGWRSLRDALDNADFVLDLADATWFDELERCETRAFVDGDPLFTQWAMLQPDDAKQSILDRYSTLFTIGNRIGAADCAVPRAGRAWIPTRSVVATRLWAVRPPRPAAPITTVMHWGAWGEVEYDGVRYGHKGREFERYIDMPRRCERRFALAVGGPAPGARLESHGWELKDPIAATRTIVDYREFIADSWADFGIAKHAYVASRSGWFSDRALCYLASGRPVLHQDTGFSEWLPTGAGVIAFSDPDEVVEAIAALERDYAAHARAARRIAEEEFEARTVIGRMLDEAGFR
jgi:hypothetical protein